MANLPRPPDPPDRAAPSSSRASPAVPLSFAAVTRSRPVDKFPPIHLPPRQYGVKEGRPVITFTAAEVQPGRDRLQHAVVAKFSSGRPPVDEIRRAFSSVWGLDGGASIGALDARHILIVLHSGEDVNRILAHPVRKVGQSLFRLFRWAPDFHSRKEPTTTSAWVRLPGLPPEVFDQGYIAAIVSAIGRFLAVDERTRTLSNPSYARACIEIDIAKPLPSEVVINILGDRTIIQPVVFEGKLLYCSKCNLHGHHLSSCRKSKPSAAVSIETGVARQIHEKHAPQAKVPCTVQCRTTTSKQNVVQPLSLPTVAVPEPKPSKDETGWKLVRNKKHRRKDGLKHVAVPSNADTPEEKDKDIGPPPSNKDNGPPIDLTVQQKNADFSVVINAHPTQDMALIGAEHVPPTSPIPPISNSPLNIRAAPFLPGHLVPEMDTLSNLFSEATPQRPVPYTDLECPLSNTVDEESDWIPARKAKQMKKMEKLKSSPKGPKTSRTAAMSTTKHKVGMIKKDNSLIQNPILAKEVKIKMQSSCNFIQDRGSDNNLEEGGKMEMIIADYNNMFPDPILTKEDKIRIKSSCNRLAPSTQNALPPLTMYSRGLKFDSMLTATTQVRAGER